MEISTEGSVAQRAGPRRYIVTGAAGHLGSTIMRQLADAGQDATGLLLPGEKEKVSSPLLRYFEGDVCDIDSLRPLFNGCAGKEVVFIHTAAVISIASRMPAGLYDVNVNGVKNILQICKQYGAKRLVHVSSVHAIPELPKGRVMTEPASFSSDLVVGGYAKTKAEAAQAVMDAAAEGLDVVAVFPSGIVGPFDEGRNHLVQLVLEFMRGALPACVAGGYDFVDVRDVAQGCLQAAERGRKGEGYILSGQYATIHDLHAMVRRLHGGREIPVLPIWIARALLPAIKMIARLSRRRPLYTWYSLHTLTSNSLYSSQKAKVELGYTVRPLEQTMRDMVRWLESAGVA